MQLIINIQMLAKKVGKSYQFEHLASLPDCELRQLQDNLIEEYNRKFA